MKLNEQIKSDFQILENSSSLPEGILARVRRTICEIGVKNANNRIYSKKVWEKVLSNPNVLKKLKDRQILGEMEHPKDSQIKLDKDRTSHIISNIFIDESSNTVKADFDLLPSEAGKFIWVLHQAGVKVPASTRADGELVEKVDESGAKFFEVAPDSYSFITVDHTGDASCSNTEPENIIKAVSKSYESKEIEKNTALALLETVHTEEADKLRIQIKEDKQHKYCKCKLGEKKCSGGCTCSTKESKYYEPPESDEAFWDEFIETKLASLNKFSIGQAQHVAKEMGFNFTKEEIQKELKTANSLKEVTPGNYVWVNESKLNEVIDEVEIDLGGEQGYIAKISYRTYVDKHWGADADGKGGEEREFIKDFELLSLKDEAGKEVTDPDIIRKTKRQLEDYEIMEAKEYTNPENKFEKYQGFVIKVTKRDASYLARILNKETDTFRQGATVGYFKSEEEGLKKSKEFVDGLLERLKLFNSEIGPMIKNGATTKDVVELLRSREPDLNRLCEYDSAAGKLKLRENKLNNSNLEKYEEKQKEEPKVETVAEVQKVEEAKLQENEDWTVIGYNPKTSTQEVIALHRKSKVSAGAAYEKAKADGYIDVEMFQIKPKELDESAFNKIPPATVQELENHDLYVGSDVVKSGSQFKKVFYIQDFEDSERGRYTTVYSPVYDTVEELLNWWQKNRYKIIGVLNKLEKEEISADRFDKDIYAIVHGVEPKKEEKIEVGVGESKQSQISKAVSIAERDKALELGQKLEVRIKELQENYKKDILESSVKTQEILALVETKKVENAKISKEILEIQKQLKESQLQIEITKKSLNESKTIELTQILENHKKEIELIKENHNLALLTKYRQTLIKARGLNLPNNFQALLENCKTEEEIDATLVRVTEMFRESLLHSNNLSETKVSIPQTLTPEQSELIGRLGAAFKGMGKKV